MAIKQSFERSYSLLLNATKIIEFDAFVDILWLILVIMKQYYVILLLFFDELCKMNTYLILKFCIISINIIFTTAQ